MSGYQRSTILGRLGKDPESRETRNKSKLCQFTVAVTEGSGERKHTEWFNVVAFDKTADVCQTYLHKGTQVLIEGRHRTRSWENQSGVTQYRTDLVAERVVFVDQVAKAGEAHAGSERTPVEIDI